MQGPTALRLRDSTVQMGRIVLSEMGWEGAGRMDSMMLVHKANVGVTDPEKRLTVYLAT